MDDLLSAADVAAKLSLHKATVHKIRKSDPTFPAPIYISPMMPRWRASDLEKWIASKVLQDAA